MSTTPSSKCSVLVVEDDVSAGRTLAQLLREDGYLVEVVLDGEVAMARLSRAPTPDVLVTDYRLPRADGLEVANFGRRLYPDLAVVMVTSYPEVIARIEQRAGVPTVILSKPLVYADLTKVLDRMSARVDS
jgi:two-component system response regulator HydG